MKSNGNLLFLFLTFSVFLFSSQQCKNNTRKIDEEELKTHLMNVNRILVKNEEQQIEKFITNHDWKMNSTGTGLRYMIYESGDGISATINNTVKIAGKIFLLDATLCYDYKKDNPLEFLVGKKDVPRGFEEAALLMKEGDKARFMIPAHLAYGMLGDKNKIPGNSALYAELELLEAGKGISDK
ncbi:MAG: FKBP-type peptidyl-prolyl cis-trans isomerase [Bacteroidia bacterium]|nr:FKBP-type peptidyl-prolyl cis-trans isomerase [Bacteroidia bacterium]